MKTKTMMAVSMFVPLCLMMFGCGTESRQLPDEAAVGDIGAVKQAVCDDCSCPYFTRCGAGGVCVSYPVFGPATPMTCVADCQCPGGHTCSGAPHGPGSYGQCVVPICSAVLYPDYVPFGGTTTFYVNSMYMPPGSFSRLYGTRDGVQDEHGSVYNLTSGTFPIVNSPGLSGQYMRYVAMFGSAGQFLCQTSPTYSYFAPY